MISYLQAVVIGLLQGVTELFPVSSLGHSVLVPAFIGGVGSTWSPNRPSSTSEHQSVPGVHRRPARRHRDRAARSSSATTGPASSAASCAPSAQSSAARRIVTTDADERLAWLLIIATIPVGITGLLFEHTFRTLFAKPARRRDLPDVNGLILLAGEQLRRIAPVEADDRIDGAGPAVARSGVAVAGEPTRRPTRGWRP